MEKFALIIAPMLAAVAITVSYLPQLRLTFKTRNVDGQSLSFWVLLVFSLTMLVIQQWGILAFTNSTAISGFVTQSLNLLFAVFMLIMVVIFRKRG